MSNHMNTKPARRREFSATTWSWSIAGLIVAFIVLFARRGPLSARISNPEVFDVPRPVEVLFGFKHWLEVCQYGTAVAMLILFVLCVSVWRRTPGHPNVLMALAVTGIVWLDPVMNWATYAVYNPQLWHLPEDWPLVRMSPTVEPFFVLAYAPFFFGPYFPAIGVLRRMQAKRPKSSFVWRRPLLSLTGLILGFGVVIDLLVELPSVRTGAYMYSQVIPFGSVFAGTPYQFPLAFQVVLITVVMIPAGLLCYRDDTGRSVAEKLSHRIHILPTRPILATFLVMFGTMNLAYLAYGSAFAAIRFSGMATSVARPYPYPEAKVYDPQGYYEQEGHHGPYFKGY